MMFGITNRIWAIIGAAVVAAVVIGLLFHFWSKSREEAAKSRLRAEETRAVTDSATDAIATQGKAAGRETAIDRQGEDNARDIKNAEGAKEVVPSAVARAGRASLCRRPQYRNHRDCVQRPIAP